MKFDDLEIFTEKGYKRKNIPYLNILNRGVFNLNFYMKNLIKNYSNVILLYSIKKKCIGFQFCNDINQLKIIKKSKYQAQISARSFINFYNIKSLGKYELHKEIINEKEIYICRLNELLENK